jgi:signal transduction histidine kinase
MFAVVRDFQLFMRPDALGSIPPVDLKPPIGRALRMARARLGGTTAVQVALGDAPAVRMPASRVTQIALNLFLNAADALSGRPWSANLVEVRLDTVEHWAVIEVQDNGPGLDPETRTQLFAPGTSTKPGGTSMGLGLAICRELARASGGDISVSSPPSGGTLFRVVLPPAAGGSRGPLPSAV